MAGDSFVHLHNHTEYSMLDGAARLTDPASRVRDLADVVLGAQAQ